MREFFNEDAQCLTSQEKSRIKKVCDLTKYYFMEKYLLSLTEFPESVISVMVNDMDRFYTDSNANKLNQSYINALARKGYPEDVLKDIRVVLPRSEFEIFSKEFYMNLCMMAENGQDVVISSDTNKLFADLGLVDEFCLTVLDCCLNRRGIPNNSSILDCCRISVERNNDGELETSAKRILFPVEKDEETTEDVSELIHRSVNMSGTLKFIDIPLEECYGKYLENDCMGIN